MARKSVPSKDRESRKITDFHDEHQPHILSEKLGAHSKDFLRGQVAIFTYKDEERWVFITHPDWHGKVHGLDMKHIPRRVLLPLFDVTQALPPEQFYKDYVNKPWVKKWDAYRTYTRNKIGSVRLAVYDTHRAPDEMSEARMEDKPKYPIVPDANIL